MRKARVVELPLTPGALSDDTDTAAKLHAIDMDKTRIRGQRWETIKGWEALNADGVASGIARGIHTWATLEGTPVAAVFSSTAAYAWIGGTRLTITPKWKDVFLNDAFSTDNSGSTVTVTWTVYTPSTAATAAASMHGLIVGDSITISGFVGPPSDVGDLDMNGTWTVATVPTPETFTFTHSGSSSGNSSTAGGICVITAAFRAGVVTGTGDTAETKPTVWTLDNFGEELVACASSGTPIFFWQPQVTYPELLDEPSFDAAGDWVDGTGWTIGGGVAVHTGASGTLKQSIDGILEGGKTYEMSFTTSNIPDGPGNGQLAIAIDAITIYPTINSNTGAIVNQTYTFRFVCPSNPAFLIFTGVQTVRIQIASIKLLSIAQVINEAPQKNYTLFVDGNRILSVLGSVEADGDFSPTLWRWSDQENFREWIPGTANVSGELPLGSGSYAVCGVTVGERVLLQTNDGVLTGFFNGTGYSVIPLATGCGAIGQKGTAVHNGKAFWVSLKGFHMYDGANVLTIECPVKDRFINKLAQYQENKTYAVIHAEYGEVWFAYPHVDDGTEISRYIAFNFIEKPNPWTFGTWDRTCMTRVSVFQYPIGIDVSGNIWKHETGTIFSGSNIVLPFIETGYASAGDGDRWIGFRRYYPDVESQAGNIIFTATGKRAPQGQNNEQAIGPFIIRPNQATVDFLLSSRQIKMRWESQTSTTQWRLGVIPIEMITDKERR